MAPRRTSKKESKVVKDNFSYDTLDIEKVLCPICRSILIEPVTLPCGHHFCYLCFNETVNNAALVCPLCRTRISSWLRAAKKDNKVINNTFWSAIQSKFAEHIENKHRGNDDNIDECLFQPRITLSTPGEINKEYKNELAKEMREVVKEREKEEKASESYIKQLQVEEELVAKAEAEKIKQDEEIARRLADEEAENVRNVHGHSFSTPGSSKKSSSKKGPLDSFVVVTDIKKCSETVNNIPKSMKKPLVSCKLDFSKMQLPIVEMISLKNNVSSGVLSTKPIKIHNHSSAGKDDSYKHKELFSSELTQNDKEKVLLEQCVQNINEVLENETEDIIKKEISHFKPITMIPRTPPKRDRHGKAIESPIIRSKAVRVIDNTMQYYRVKSPYQTLISPENEVHHSAFKINLNFDALDSISQNKQLKIFDRLELNKQEANEKYNNYGMNIKNCQFTEKTNESKETEKSQNISSIIHSKPIQKHVTDFSNQFELNFSDSSNSPFCGFEKENVDGHVQSNSVLKSNNVTSDNSVKKNSNIKFSDSISTINDLCEIKKTKVNEIVCDKTFEDDIHNSTSFEESIIYQQRLLEQAIIQEQKDFELACKLQEELNRVEPRTYTLRNGEKRTPEKNNRVNGILLKSGSKSRKRQSTIEELCSRKKYKV